MPKDYRHTHAPLRHPLSVWLESQQIDPRYLYEWLEPASVLPGPRDIRGMYGLEISLLPTSSREVPTGWGTDVSGGLGPDRHGNGVRTREGA